MSKTVVIHQPDFIPHLGFFDRFIKADFYVVLDHVQFVNGSRRAWTHRDKIKTPQGEKWLTISTKKAPRDTAINQIELSDSVDWRGKNIQLLESSYSKAEYFSEIMPEVKDLYSTDCNSLSEFNIKSIEMLMDMLDVKIPLILSSKMNFVGSKNELLISILQEVNATHYLSGLGASGYMDVQKFNDIGIEVIWQEFCHPVYPQLFDKFIPHLSSLDILFNCGIDKSRQILKGIEN